MDPTGYRQKFQHLRRSASAQAPCLRSDGVINRWKIDLNTNRWGAPTAFTGFSSVKAMALIAETATYDTFLEVTHGGAPYTIRILLGSPLTGWLGLLLHTAPVISLKNFETIQSGWRFGAVGAGVGRGTDGGLEKTRGLDWEGKPLSTQYPSALAADNRQRLMPPDGPSVSFEELPQRDG